MQTLKDDGSNGLAIKSFFKNFLRNSSSGNLMKKKILFSKMFFQMSLLVFHFSFLIFTSKTGWIEKGELLRERTDKGNKKKMNYQVNCSCYKKKKGRKKVEYFL